MGKDAVYRFLSSSRGNWRRFLGFLAQMVIKGLFEPLTDEKREKVLILDTTLYDRSRSGASSFYPEFAIIAAAGT